MKRFNSIVIAFCSLALAANGIARQASEQKVTFEGAGKVQIAGTLLLPSPESGSKCPAMVLLAGSGPTNRDGNQPPALMTDLLKQIAEKLADDGIATLRFDKRGMYANAASLPKDPANYPAFFSWDNFVEDSASAFRFLRDQPRIDRDKVGIAGHSEGGLLALDAARLLKAQGKPAAALVLLSTPGRTIDVVIGEQLDSLLARQGATAQQTEYFKNENARIVRIIRETGQVPGDVPPGLKALYPSYLGPFFKGELAVDPCKLAAEFTGPVLVVNGSADTQVSAERDAKLLDQALSKRPRDVHQLTIMEHASHNLKIVEKPQDPGFAGTVAPKVMEKLSDWAKAQLTIDGK